VITLDYLHNASTEKALITIPAGTFAECDGTLVNNEGRAQRFYQGYAAPVPIAESWRWLNEMMQACSRKELSHLKIFDDYVKALMDDYAVFKGIDKLAPPADFRIAGQKIPRSPHRYTGRTAMHADKNVSEAKPAEDADSALSFTMEGYRGKPHSSLIPFFWSPGWNSAQSINKFQIEIGGALHDGDPGLRLIEKREKDTLAYFINIPDIRENSKGQWLLFPVYHIFGSEPLSLLSSAIKERTPQACIVLSSADARKINVQNGQKVKITLDRRSFLLPCKTDDSLAPGTAGVSVIPGETPFSEWPVMAALSGGKQ